MDLFTGLGGGIGPAQTFTGGPSTEGVVRGGGGGGGGGMFEWTPPAKKGGTGSIGPGGVMVGRKFVRATGTGSGKEVNRTYSVKVTLKETGLVDRSGVDVEVVDGFEVGKAPVGAVSFIPLYTIGKDGQIEEDYRGATTVPVYE